MRSMMEIQLLLAVQFSFLVVFLPPQLSALFPTWLSTVPQLYLLDLIILPKKKKLNRDRDTTGLVEVIVQRSCLMKKIPQRSLWFCKGCNRINKRMCYCQQVHSNILKCIMTPSFVSLDMFAVWLVHNNDECLGYHIDAMLPFMPMRIYRWYDLS